MAQQKAHPILVRPSKETEKEDFPVNIDGKEGSCGFMTVIPAFSPLYPIRLFRVDNNGELERDARGYLIPIKPGFSNPSFPL